MKKIIPFLLWAVMWSVTGPTAAEDRILRVQVVDVAGVPQARLLIGLAGEGTFQSTDQQGNARLPLPAQARVGDPVTLRLSNKALVFISPSEGRTHIPSFDEKPGNFVTALVGKLGELTLLKSGDVLRSFLNQVLGEVERLQERSTEATATQLRTVLDERAGGFGLNAEDFDRAIRAWLEAPVGLDDKRLAARYLELYPEPVSQNSYGSVVVGEGASMKDSLIVTNPQNSPITIQNRRHDVDSALSVIARAVEARPTGDIGQIAAAEFLAGQEGPGLKGMDLAGLSFTGATLETAKLSEAILDGADFSHANLQKADLSSAKLGFSTLQEATLAEALLEGTRFYFVSATKAIFDNARAAGSNWTGADVRGASFRGADLRGASFAFTDLTGADFTGADLTETLFISAILTDVRFDGATVRNTDATAAVGDVSIFTPVQQQELCATGLGQGSGQVELVRVVPSTRFSSGSDYDRLTYGNLPALEALHLLDPCTLRIHRPAGFETVWSAGNNEYVKTAYAFHYPSDLLDKGSRSGKFAARLKEQLKRLDEAMARGPFIAVRGKTHAALARALKANLGKTAPLAPLDLFDEETIFLLTLRFLPKEADKIDWHGRAQNRMRDEQYRKAHPDDGPSIWPIFFPEGFSSNQLGAEHVELYRQWTQGRLKRLPLEFTLTTRFEGGARSRSRRTPQPETAGAPVRAALLASFGEPLPDGLLGKVGGGAADGFAFDVHGEDYALVFAQSRAAYVLDIPGEIAEELATQNPQGEVRIRFQGAEIVELESRRYPEQQENDRMTVFRVEPISIRLVGRQGLTFPSSPAEAEKLRIIPPKQAEKRIEFRRRLCTYYTVPASALANLRDKEAPDLPSIQSMLSDDPSAESLKTQEYLLRQLNDNPGYADILADYFIQTIASGESKEDEYLGPIYKRKLGEFEPLKPPASCR
ncbi:MAG TPA: pentapeptide repeat-containing protein [Thermoanaerobaculia bacterium]|nr:pentapeptide repeat-containing protein [Thermoanaerobaculia bacterium]